MGYAVYWHWKHQRHCGYGVPAYCDQPGCMEEINRGMAYVCGEPLADQFGCGLYFCEKHMVGSRKVEHRYYDQCSRCLNYRRTSHKPKPEHPDWIRHVLKDKTWKQWRDENPRLVAEYKSNLKALI